MEVTAFKQTPTGIRGMQHQHMTAVQDKIAIVAISEAEKAYFIWYPAPTVKGMIEVIHALYYLPHNFILMLPRKVSGWDMITSMVAIPSIANRLQFYETEGSPKSGPSLYADIVIGEETGAKLAISKVAHAKLKQPVNAYQEDVGYSPEAIASAVLNISRTN